MSSPAKRIEICCGETDGWFYPEELRVVCMQTGESFSPQDFEAYSGKASCKNWRRSLKEKTSRMAIKDWMERSVYLSRNFRSSNPQSPSDDDTQIFGHPTKARTEDILRLGKVPGRALLKPKSHTKRFAKKMRKGGQRSSSSHEVEPMPKESQEYMVLTKLKRGSSEANLRALERQGPVQLSKIQRAGLMWVSPDGLTVSSRKGYRMIRATRAVTQGAWFYEAKIDFLGSSGHVRIGWSTAQGELNAPVGFDRWSYGYHDIQGAKVHRAERTSYGEPFKEGDVIGIYIYLPPTEHVIKEYDDLPQELVRWKGKLYAATPVVTTHESNNLSQPLPGSLIQFYKNGRTAGEAFRDINEGAYYPAVSLYTNPTEQEAPAEVTFNFSQNVAFPMNVDNA
ncbi:hypothetical protein CYMTET_26971, partial [Cymbomonas tetramitiformis]